MIPLGIDLGTTFSLVGHVNGRGIPTLLPDQRRGTVFRTPSVVHVDGAAALVGAAAEAVLDEDPAASLVRFAKLAMGSPQPAFVDDDGREWAAPALSALVLRKLISDAQVATNEDPGHVVIAVPAQFDDAQRRATKQAGRLAGLRDVALIEEPVAAANYYGVAQPGGDRTLFVFDLGGGTFDATLLQASPDGLYVVATEGTSKVGGRDFDRAIMQFVASEFRRRHGVDPLGDPSGESALRRFAESSKIELSRPGAGRVAKTLLLCGRAYDVVLTRRQFARLIAPLVDQTLEVSRRCLASCGLQWPDVDRLLLTGGSTLVPPVQEALRRDSGLPGASVILNQPHQAVAFGASILAANQAGEGSIGAPLVQQIAGFDLCMRVLDRQTGKPALKTLIRRNSPLPARHASTVFTTRDQQRRLVFEFVQAREDSETSLGHFVFEPLPEVPRNHPIELTVAYDEQSMVHIEARDGRSGRRIERSFSREGGDEGEGFADMKRMVADVQVLG